MKTLIEQAKEYLGTYKGNYKSIAKETGLGMDWLYRFMSKRSIAEPSVNKIETILRHRNSNKPIYPPNEVA